MKNAYFAKAHKEKMSYDENGWYKKFSKPDFLERKFAWWYSHVIVNKYKETFGHLSLGLWSEKKEEELVREFGWVHKDYKYAPNSLSQICQTSCCHHQMKMNGATS